MDNEDIAINTRKDAREGIGKDEKSRMAERIHADETFRRTNDAIALLPDGFGMLKEAGICDISQDGTVTVDRGATLSERLQVGYAFREEIGDENIRKIGRAEIDAAELEKLVNDKQKMKMQLYHHATNMRLDRHDGTEQQTMDIIATDRTGRTVSTLHDVIDFTRDDHSDR